MEAKDVFLLIKNIHDKFDSRANADCQTAGLTIAQFRVLLYLEDHPDSDVTQKELETVFKVSHPTINGILSRLESKNCIFTKVVIKAGKQQKHIFLTTQGNMALKNMKDNRIHDEKMFETSFTDQEKKELEELLKRLYQILE